MLFFTSCYYDNREELYPVDPNACMTDDLTYTNGIKIIIDKSCATVGCHSARAPYLPLTTYNEVINKLDRIEVRVLQEQTMPPVMMLSSCDQKKIAQWIADGAPE